MPVTRGYISDRLSIHLDGRWHVCLAKLIPTPTMNILLVVDPTRVGVPRLDHDGLGVEDCGRVGLLPLVAAPTEQARVDEGVDVAGVAAAGGQLGLVHCRVAGGVVVLRVGVEEDGQGCYVGGN